MVRTGKRSSVYASEACKRCASSRDRDTSRSSCFRAGPTLSWRRLSELGPCCPAFSLPNYAFLLENLTPQHPDCNQNCNHRRLVLRGDRDPPRRLLEIGGAHDVVAIEDRARLVPADLHGHGLGDARVDHVPDCAASIVFNSSVKTTSRPSSFLVVPGSSRSVLARRSRWRRCRVSTSDRMRHPNV